MRACNRACNEGMQLGDWATAQARAAPNHFRYTAAAITLRDTIHRYRCDAGPMAWIMRDPPPLLALRFSRALEVPWRWMAGMLMRRL